MKTNDDLSIYPVRIDEEKLNTVNKYPLLPIPFFLCILGRVKSGKSTILNSLTLSPRFYGNDFQVKILISPTAHSDPAMEHIVEHFDFVFEDYSETLLEEIIEMVENDEHDQRFLLVLDDVITSSFKQSKSGKVDSFSSLATKYRHIKNNNTGKEGMLSIILTLQYFKFMSVITRTMCMGLIIAGQMSDTELRKIADAYDFMGVNGSSKSFIELYKKCKVEPFDFCFINVDSLEMRKNFDTLVHSKKQELEGNKNTENSLLEDSEEEEEKKESENEL
jgi:predicted O-methyltransferase YrrM